MNSRAASASMALTVAGRPRPTRGGPGRTGASTRAQGKRSDYISVSAGLPCPPRSPSIPLVEVAPYWPPPFIDPETFSLRSPTLAWVFSQGPRPEAEPARNPMPNVASVFMRNSFMPSPPLRPVSPCQKNVPSARGTQTADRRSEPGGEPFAAGIRGRRQPVAVAPDEMGVAHEVLVWPGHLDAVPVAAQPVDHRVREPILDPHGEVAGVDHPPGGGQGGGGIG